MRRRSSFCGARTLRRPSARPCCIPKTPRCSAIWHGVRWDRLACPEQNSRILRFRIALWRALAPGTRPQQTAMLPAVHPTPPEWPRYHDAPGVGAILKPGKLFGSFDMEDSSVPAAIFASGKEAAERMQAYRQAGGDMDAVANYAAFDLRRTAETDDGTLDPKKYDTWDAQPPGGDVGDADVGGKVPDRCRRAQDA